MNLNSLLAELGLEHKRSNPEVTDVTDVIDNVKCGSLFVCIEGDRFDGHSFAGEAINKGAVAVISEKPLELENSIQVRDTRAAYSFLCAAFYGHPEDSLKIIGITGTNGKTTTAEYLRYILEREGKKTGIIGTLGCAGSGERAPVGFTTPSCSILFSQLRQIADDGCEYCVMEVSSQALSQKRTDAISFVLGIFTNISGEHLDYHKNMENYAAAKKRLFMFSEKALINADDAYADEFVAAAENKQCALYSAHTSPADFSAKNIRLSASGCDYILFHDASLCRINLNALGEFSVYNSLAAVAAAVMLGVPEEKAAEYACSLPQIKGRAQKIDIDGKCTVYIDFAHTPDALSNILSALKAVKKGRLITVFGCGGERDSMKRPQMGSTAVLLSDEVIVTSDNPRNENPEKIIEDIMSGIKNREHVKIEPDRAKAIANAIEAAKAGDIVIVAGKGHEEYQITASGKAYFSDEQTVLKLLKDEL